MATYISLGNFTEQGLRTIKDTTKRAAAVAEAARKFGVTVKGIYWTLGEYDLVTIVEAADPAQLTAFRLEVSRQGNVRGQTLTAFNADEMSAILSKLS